MRDERWDILQDLVRGWGLQKDHCESESMQGQEWEVHPTLGGDGIYYTF